ncbi:hypothetical protein C5167_032708 [Papaver somniferum]|uniref:Uncharacterized protein n=1 Tax=Papaver somniferum TaxID=3469 RepID=A0A4Y7KB49_PAPSO|nr:hypothetical protein C5167_032708 [Papaver somniferum]
MSSMAVDVLRRGRKRLDQSISVSISIGDVSGFGENTHISWSIWCWRLCGWTDVTTPWWKMEGIIIVL